MTILDEARDAAKTVFGGAMGGLLARAAHVSPSDFEASAAVGLYGVLLFLFATFVFWSVGKIVARYGPGDDAEGDDQPQIAS